MIRTSFLAMATAIAPAAATVVASLVPAGAALARPVVWLCETTTDPRLTVIAPEIAISHDEATGKAVVSDAWILHYRGVPIAAGVSDAGQSVTFSWRLTGLRSRNGVIGTLAFSVTIDKASGAMAAWAKPLGHDDEYDAKGSCVRSR